MQEKEKINRTKNTEEPFEDKIARISFKRLNRITIINGLILISLAFINFPFIIDEQGNFYFELLGQPGVTFIIEMNIYIFIGIIPIIFGLIFIVFSIITSRAITLNFLKKGDAESTEIIYHKNAVAKNFLVTNEKLLLPEEIQEMIIGKRHQRFLSWASFGLIFFLIYLLTDYINFLNFSFDMIFVSAGFFISTRWMLTINILLLIIVAFLIILFPRRLFQLDTPEDFIKFDYNTCKLERFSDESKAISLLDVFEFGHLGNKKIIEEPEIVIIYDLKETIGEVPKSHIPLFNLIVVIGYLFLVLVIQIIPDFFLLDFTADIYYFITYNSVFFFIRILHSWFSEQIIRVNKDSIICSRKNPLVGKWVSYNNFETMDYEYHTHKPHYLEYFVIFFPLIEIIWVINNLVYFSGYFITNIYTWGYILTVVGIIVFIFLEYNSPSSMLSLTPKFQSSKRRKESFLLFFPINHIDKIPSFKEAYKSKNFKEILKENMIMLIPIIFGIIWVIFSVFGILPALEDTLF
jgi:hypothetical protein